MQRKRHMVDISDYAWDKLERLAGRLDAAQFVYKGRPRYGKLIELAIEKLEDSTMEWTVEEVELTQDKWYGDTPEGEETIEWDSKKGWWKGDKLDKWKPEKQWWEMDEHELAEYKLANNVSYGVSQGGPVYFGTDPHLKPIQAGQAAQDMTLHDYAVMSVDFASGTDSHVTLKPIKASSVSIKPKQSDTPMLDAFKKNAATVSFTASAADKAAKSVQDLANAMVEQEYEALGKKMSDALLDGITNAIAGKKPIPPVPHVMWKMSQPGYIELTGTITQALSAPQQMILRNFAYAAFAEFSNDEGENALSVTMKNVPWNKLWISATYADPSKLVEKLQDIGKHVAKKVEKWLLQGNFIGPLPQAVDIAESKVKQVSCQHKTEKAIDSYGTLRVYNTYNFKVSLTPFDSIALTDNKYKISNILKTLLLDKHGYDPYSTKAGERVLWDDDHDGTVRISTSIIKNFGTYGLGQSQEFMTKAIEYLTIVANSIQNHPHEPVF